MYAAAVSIWKPESEETLTEILKRSHRFSVVSNGMTMESLKNVVSVLRDRFDGLVDIVLYDTLYEDPGFSTIVRSLFERIRLVNPITF